MNVCDQSRHVCVSATRSTHLTEFTLLINGQLNIRRLKLQTLTDDTREGMRKHDPHRGICVERQREAMLDAILGIRADQ